MKYLDFILPKFYESSHLQSYRGKVKTKDLFGSDKTHIKDNEWLERKAKLVSKVFYVLPFGMYFADCDYETIAYLKKHSKEITANIFVLDYSPVLKDIVHIGTDTVEFQNARGGREEYEIYSSKLINEAIDKPAIKPFEFFKNDKVLKESYILESDMDLEAFQSVITTLSKKAEESKETLEGESAEAAAPMLLDTGDQVREIIRDVLLSPDDATYEVPHLIGVSGVMKSQLVKNYAKEILEDNKPKFRYVEFRLSFMDKFDFTGLIGKIDSVEKEYKQRFSDEEWKELSRVAPRVSFDAFQANFVECSDQFIDYCSKFATKLEEFYKDKKKSLSDADNKFLLNMIEDYRDKSRPALIFFDEFVRMRASLTKVLMGMLDNSRSLGSLTFKKSRIICASNIAPEDEWEGRLQNKEMFNIPLEADPAFKRRVKTYAIKIKSVQNMWLKWGESKDENKDNRTNIHPLLLKYFKEKLSTHPNVLYDLNLLLKISDIKGSAGNDNPMTSTPHPNYRAFHFLSDYLYNVLESGKGVSSHVVLGFIGDESSLNDNSIIAGRSFLSFLKSNGVSVISEGKENVYDSLVNACLNYKTPILLIGPSAVGKTSRIKNMIRIERASGRLVEDVNISLAMADRGSISGAVERVNLDKFIKMDAASHISDIGEFRANELLDEFKSSGVKFHDKNLPIEVTAKIPNQELHEKVLSVRKYNETNRPLIKAGKLKEALLFIFIDEVNRVIDPILMSSVFELISDHRFKGVTIDPEYTRIILACNLGSEMDVQELDQALIARCCVAKKMEYDESDAQSYYDYFISNEKIYPPMKKFMKKITKDGKDFSELLTWLKTVDKADFTCTVPTSSNIESFSFAISSKENRLNNILIGYLPFASNEVSNIIQKDILAISRKIYDMYKEYLKDAEEITDKNGNKVYKYKKSPEEFKELSDITNLFGHLISKVESVLKIVQDRTQPFNWNLIKYKGEVSLETNAGVRKVRVRQRAMQYYDFCKDYFEQGKFHSNFTNILKDKDKVLKVFDPVMSLIYQLSEVFCREILVDIVRIERGIYSQRNMLLKTHLDTNSHTKIVPQFEEFLQETGGVEDDMSPEWLLDMGKVESYFNRVFSGKKNQLDIERDMESRVYVPLNGFVGKGFKLSTPHARLLFENIINPFPDSMRAVYVMNTFVPDSFPILLLKIAESGTDKIKWVSHILRTFMQGYTSKSADSIMDAVQEYMQELYNSHKASKPYTRPEPKVKGRE